MIENWGLTYLGGNGKGRICSITWREFRFIIGSLVWFADLYLQLRYWYLAFGIRLNLQGNDGNFLAQSCLCTNAIFWPKQKPDANIITHLMTLSNMKCQPKKLWCNQLSYSCAGVISHTLGRIFQAKLWVWKNACIVLNCLIWCNNLERSVMCQKDTEVNIDVEGEDCTSIHFLLH